MTWMENQGKNCSGTVRKFKSGGLTPNAKKCVQKEEKFSEGLYCAKSCQAVHGKNYTDIVMDKCDLTNIPIWVWDSNKKMTCPEKDYALTCTFPKVCGKGGCYDCPSGNHLCEDGRGYYSASCPDGQKCHSSGCIDGEDPDNPRLCLTYSPEDDPVVRLPPLRLLCRGP